MMMSKTKFYLLSFTWGLPLTLIGVIGAIFFLILGFKPQKWDYGWYFEVGKHWGGFEGGPVFFVQHDAGEYLKCHELGHGVQNCYFGPLTLFVVTIPSIVRYWVRELVRKVFPEAKLSDYYSVWFEQQASVLGLFIHRKYQN